MTRGIAASVESMPGTLAGWQAELSLRFRAGARTVLAERRHRGPLVIQRPFYPEGDPCHVYLVHPPGGVVGGDELRVNVDLEPGAHALITTPAATKFYRCEGRSALQAQELRAAGATLEWLPQENIFYRGAAVRAATRVWIDEATRFIGWDIGCLGLPARGEHFDAGALRLDFELWRASDSRPLFVDRLRLAGGAPALAAAWGLSGHAALGTLLAAPAGAAELDAVHALLGTREHAALSLVDGVLVLRALAAQGEAVRQLFIEAWRCLRPAVIGRTAVPPRIWAT